MRVTAQELFFGDKMEAFRLARVLRDIDENVLFFLL